MNLSSRLLFEQLSWFLVAQWYSLAFLLLPFSLLHNDGLPFTIHFLVEYHFSFLVLVFIVLMRNEICLLFSAPFSFTVKNSFAQMLHVYKLHMIMCSIFVQQSIFVLSPSGKSGKVGMRACSKVSAFRCIHNLAYMLNYTFSFWRKGFKHWSNVRNTWISPHLFQHEDKRM